MEKKCNTTKFYQNRSNLIKKDKKENKYEQSEF